MKQLAFTFWLVLLMLPSLPGQDPDQGKVGKEPDKSRVKAEAAYEAKISRPFRRAIEWQTELATAKNQAEERGQPIVGYFTVSSKPSRLSDECERGPLVASWWVEASPSFVAYLNIESGIPDHPDQGLYLERKLAGWPRFLFMEPTGNTLFRTPPPESQAQLALALDDARRMMAAAGALRDPTQKEAAAATLEILRMIRHEISPDQTRAQALLKVPGVNADFGPRVERLGAEREIDAAFDGFLRSRVREGPSLERRVKFEASLYTFFRAGKVLEDPARPRYAPYWRAVFEAAVRAQDRSSAETAHRRVLRAFGSDPRYEKIIEAMNARLKELETADRPKPRD